MEAESKSLSSALHLTENQLCYNGQQCHKIPEVLIKLYGNKIHSLDLSFNCLVTLKGLEGFIYLKELILDNNQLSDNLVLPHLPHLHTLSLNKNLINDLELLLLKITANMPSLIYLSLLGNKACPNELSDLENDEKDYQRYRCFVIYHLQSLKFLDSSKITDLERIEATKRGCFMKIVRPSIENNSNDDGSPTTHPFTPLPRNIKHPDDHKGAYAKCRYKYSGKHSEGNRFILNSDL